LLAVHFEETFLVKICCYQFQASLLLVLTILPNIAEGE